MDEDLISKKELLELTGISYGALYRWKRKRLIPEDWFIKKSTFTGPETFFPRELALERIAKIQEKKELLSLDDLAQTFSHVPLDLQTSARQMAGAGLLSEAVSRMKLYSPDSPLDFYGALYYVICDKLLTDGSVSSAEADSVLEHLLSGYKSFGTPPHLTLYRKAGVSFSLLWQDKCLPDSGAKQIASIDTARIWEMLKSNERGLY